MIPLGVLLGAPAAFWFLHKGDSEKAKEAAGDWEKKFREQWQQKLRAFEDKEKQLDRDRRALEFKVFERDCEIDRLKEREKYLTEGKPPAFEESPEPPDLDCF